MQKARTMVLIAGAMSALVTGLSGCQPFSMGIFTPIPVPPWVTERMEEKYCHERDHKTPIMPPIKEGFPPPLCEDAPSEAEVIRAMPHISRGVPYYCEEFRDKIEITSERMIDKIDPVRFFPVLGRPNSSLPGSARSITETIESGSHSRSSASSPGSRSSIST